MIPLFKVCMNNTDEFKQDLFKTITSGFITQGQKVEDFEAKLKEYLRHDNILTLNSGTSALTLAFRLLNLSSDDEVISTPLTCVATNFSILANNLKIKWADIDPNTLNVDLEDVKKKLTSKTKVLCFVHWGGNIIDYDKLNEVKSYAKSQFNIDLKVVEDCAHTFSPYVDMKNNICIFSLQAIKHLTTVDGGILSVPNKELYERGKLLRWYGVDRDPSRRKDFRIEEDIPEWGYKFHMNDVNATIGLHNLALVDENIRIMRENANYYNTHLQGLSSVNLLNYNKNSVYWLYTLLVKNRDNFVEYMKYKGIQASKVHKRNDGHTCLNDFKCDLPLLDDLEKYYVCIPVGWWVNNIQLDHIKDCIYKWDKIHKITIRDVNSDDFDSIKLLQKTLNNYTIDYDKEEFVNRLQRIKNTDIIKLAEIENKVVGMAKLNIETKFTENVGKIEDVVVLAEYRGNNISNMIIKELIQEAKNKKCYKIVLSCKDKYTTTYQKSGFVKADNCMILRLE